VEPLALRVDWPPQVTFAGRAAPPSVPLLLPPHADKITAAAVKKLSAAPNLFNFNLIPSNGTMR
jgi:hypothetical protein